MTHPISKADFRDEHRYISRAWHVRAFGVCAGEDVMTGSTRSSEGLDPRRKRLLFRCWHRGTREMDLILGRFADAEISNLTDDEMAELEGLMDVPDPDLYAALSDPNAALPPGAGALFKRIRDRDDIVRA